MLSFSFTSCSSSSRISTYSMQHLITHLQNYCSNDSISSLHGIQGCTQCCSIVVRAKFACKWFICTAYLNLLPFRIQLRLPEAHFRRLSRGFCKKGHHGPICTVRRFFSSKFHRCIGAKFYYDVIESAVWCSINRICARTQKGLNGCILQ